MLTALLSLICIHMATTITCTVSINKSVEKFQTFEFQAHGNFSKLQELSNHIMETSIICWTEEPKCISSLVSLQVSWQIIYFSFSKGGKLFFVYTELPKYYAQLLTAVTRGLGLPAGQLAGHRLDVAPKYSLCYFSSVSEQMVMRIDVHLQSGDVSVY